jgi:pimeloyl-ACP methyl ester carboxylesterase
VKKRAAPPDPNRHIARRTPRRPSSALAERWIVIDGVPVFYRESPVRLDPPHMVHLHGFGLSGRYLLPTAELLRDDFHTLVPDLPGFGRSGRLGARLDIPDLAEAAVRFLDAKGIDRASLVGNSMGCPVIVEFAYRFPDRIDRAVLVSPAGGLYNQPLRRAMTQLARDGGREPRKMITVATPDYLRFGVPSTFRLFRALTQFPSLDRLLALNVPTLAVIGTRDPLIPHFDRVREIAAREDNHILLVVLEGAAHAINFSHPRELAHIIRLFTADRAISDAPGAHTHARAFELHRGVHLPDVERGGGTTGGD